MAYRRRGRRTLRRRSYRRRRTLRRNPIKRTLTRMLETKKNEYEYNEVSMNTGGTALVYVEAAQALTQGSSYANISGHKVLGVGIKSNFVLHNNAANPQFVRHLILVNRQGHGYTQYRTGASLFEDSTGDVNFTTMTTNRYLTARINKEFYHVLVDHIIKLGGATDSSKIYAYKKYIPLRHRTIWYNGSGTRPARNNIVELWISAEADDDATGEVVEMTGCQTFYFKDI